MKQKLYSLRLSAARWHLLCVLLCAVMVVMVFSQNSIAPKTAPSPSSSSRLKLIHADVSRGVEQEGVPLRILEGNVHIQQDTLHLYCERAIYNPREHKIILEGKVKLVQGTTLLTAQKITYFEDSKTAIAEGNVRIEQPGRLLKTPFLVYNYQTDATRAEQRVEIVDDSQRVTIRAGRGEYLPDKQVAFVEENSHLIQIDTTATDTLHIFAHRLTYYFHPQRKAIASHNVRIVQDGIRATCDSIIYFLEDSVAVLRVQPQARQEGNILTGERMTLYLQKMRVKKIIVEGNKAHAVSVADSLKGWQNQLQGKQIILHLQEGQLHYLEAIQQASSAYYIEDNNQFVGKNEATADTIRVFFKDSQVDSIAVIGGAEGIYRPIKPQEATTENP